MNHTVSSKMNAVELAHGVVDPAGENEGDRLADAAQHGEDLFLILC